MRVLVAGATGVIGRPLIAALNSHGHAVAGLTRDSDNVDLLSRLGAQPLLADVLDRDATAAAVLDARPDVVVEQLTALPRSYAPQAMRATLAATGAVRTVGGDNFYAAAVARARHLVPPRRRRRRATARRTVFPARNRRRSLVVRACFEGPTTTSLARNSASIRDACHGIEIRALTTCAPV